MVKSLRQQHAEATRRALVRAARVLYLERGFAQTSVEDVAAKARVTTGALYHHFKSKQDLMEAVFEALEQQFVDRFTGATSAAPNAREAIRAGVRAVLETSLEPAVRRIGLEEAPAALGWERWKATQERYGLRLLKPSLEALRDEGRLGDVDTDVLASLLLAALVDASAQVASAEDPKAAIEENARVFEALFDGLDPSLLRQR